MAQGKGNPEGGGNTEAAAFVFIVVVLLAMWALWAFARPVILFPAFAMDTASIWIIETVRKLGGGGLGEAGQTAKNFVTSVFDGRRDPWKGVTFSEFYTVRDLVGTQTRMVIAAIISFLAAWVVFKMKGKGFTRTFSLAGGKGKPPSFALYQAERWRTASVSASFEPDGRDRDIRPPATPLEWLRDNGIEYENSILDRDAVEAAFARQLGDNYHGFARMNLIQKTIAILIGMHLKQRGDAVAAREAINIAWAAGGDGTQAMKELVKKHSSDTKLVKAIEKVMSRHAYVHTGFYALIDRARAASGVLASSDFLWLRRTDRTLHYVLNNAGRRRFHTEGAGVVSHYFAERVSKMPLADPQVEQAIDGVDEYLSEQGVISLSEFFNRADPDDDD